MQRGSCAYCAVPCHAVPHLSALQELEDKVKVPSVLYDGVDHANVGVAKLRHDMNLVHNVLLQALLNDHLLGLAL